MSLLTGPRCLAFIGKVVKTVRTAGVKAGYYRGIFYAISLFEIEEKNRHEYKKSAIS